jgi:hypothetical protein
MERYLISHWASGGMTSCRPINFWDETSSSFRLRERD